ncbi:amino acid adenylation domain-containing protein (plasmid) [Caballeronia sp. NK8]|uniref:non-ribosomal peptide synthetase n=1 Tax=Caballeronia sp. NK8 TaxID=140098 RepID=UPI001BB5CF9D|nr:non-ribosomal peptide synthetase [Caballeronia sp. NK8]BCQ27995.1 amino acid adenylation domain-containing protein [Caballeronia sp. NK8]
MTSTRENKPDLLSLATRFAQLPDAQRKVFVARLADAGIDFRMLPIPSRARGDACVASVPASFAQTRLWLHARMIDEPAAYHITERLQLDGALDANALRLSCDALIARHEALRTTFAESADGVLQTVHAPMRSPWQSVDLTHVPVAEREARAAALALADEARPFDLAHAPLMRAHLIRLDAHTHWLSLTTHHIVSDGWSADIALAELASFYRAYARGEAVSVAPLPIQYADFALWQRRWLDAGERERQLDFWRARLDPSRDVLMLPGAAARPSERSARGARHVFTLDAALAARLRVFANERRATPFAVLLAALNALFARASGEAHIQIGVPAANRERAETAGLIGFFVNTLTLAARVDATQPFATFVDAAQDALVDAQSHQDVPFEQVVEALGVVRSASHHPLFQVMTAYGARRALPAFADVRATELSSGTPFAKFDLTASFEERAHGSLAAAFIYALDLFEADAIERLARRFVELLRDALDAPQTLIGDLQWLPQDERAQLDAWNRNAPEHAPAFVSVQQRIARHAHARPDARGVADMTRAFTRGEVDARATRIAQRLIAAGVRAEMRVGVALSRSVDLLVGLIAALKSGGAFVPLDPSHPRERLAQILNDARIEHIVTERASLDALPVPPNARILLLDDESLYSDDETSRIALPEVVSEQAAYAIYTSGSTGKPKGVIVDHGSFARHCVAIAERYGATEQDTFMLFQSVNFDGAHEGWFSQYISGAAVAITADTLWPPALTCRLMRKEGVTMTYVPPGCATQLAEWALVHGAPPTLKSITVGGEATSREAFALMRRAFPNARIVNGYGPTETVITPMLWMFNPGDDPAKLADCAYLPIGTLVGARTAHVLDERLNPLPVGVIGELYLGGEGVGVARGYLDRPALTAERFVPDPYGEPGARLYRTGDLVRRRADGVFDFIGRVDHQVKLRGLRIELGEIEAQLAAHDDVREACAVVRGKGAQAALVAYVELKADARERAALGRAADAAELDAHLRRTLPDYMVPAHIVVLDALPRNANSKVDRAVLPEPPKKERVYEAPAAGAEAALAKIWREVLNVERVGRADHFFELGGHSLAAVRVVTRVAETLGRDVPVRALFETPVLSQYAKRVVQASACEGAASDVVQAAFGPDANGVWPLSAAQLGLWFLWRAQPHSAAYNIPVAVRLRGPLDADALREALAQAAARHPALRTQLVEREGALPGQRITPMWHVDLPVIDLAGRFDEAKCITDEDALTPFDLAAAKHLWRAHLLRLADDDHVLSLVVHHIVSDGTSIDLWLDDIRATYVALQKGASVSERVSNALVLPSSATGARLAFWRDALRDVPAITLPAPASGRAEDPQWFASRIAFDLDGSLVERARSLAMDCHATLPMLLHAALNAALHGLTGADDQPIGVLASTRESTGDAARDALGLFINAVVVRTRMTKRDTPANVLATVRDAALAAYAHADVPFADVVSALNAPRPGAGNPLFQVMFNYLRPAAMATRDWAGLAIEGFDDVRHRVVFDLELDVTEYPDGRVSCSFSYANERVDGGFVETLAKRYLATVEQFAHAPHDVFDASEAALESGPRAVAVAPSGEASADATALADVWRECFDGQTVTPHQDLFAAGATSFAVVRFVDAARKAGFDIAIQDVFATPHFAGLAATLARRVSLASTNDI